MNSVKLKLQMSEVEYEHAELSISNNMHFLHPHQVVVLKCSEDEYPLTMSFRHFNIPKYKTLEEGRQAAIELCNELGLEIRKDDKSMPINHDKCRCVFCNPHVDSPVNSLVNSRDDSRVDSRVRVGITINEKREMFKKINQFKLKKLQLV